MRTKLLAFLLGFINLLAVVGAVAFAQIWLAPRLLFVAGQALAAALAVAVYLAGTRFIERRRPVELRLNRSIVLVAAGLALGVALFSSVMGILWLAGVYRPSGWGSVRPLGAGLLFAFAAGIGEEIIFRGLLFRLIAALGGNWTALAITSALFGLGHIANPQATVASSAAIAIEAGILLGAAYAATGSLWLPIGLHAGWNFTEGSVFGMTLSGHEMAAGLISGKLSGPVLLTGGRFGPEASIIAVLACLAVAVAFLRKMKKLPDEADSTSRTRTPAAQTG